MKNVEDILKQFYVSCDIVDGRPSSLLGRYSISSVGMSTNNNHMEFFNLDYWIRRVCGHYMRKEGSPLVAFDDLFLKYTTMPCIIYAQCETNAFYQESIFPVYSSPSEVGIPKSLISFDESANQYVATSLDGVKAKYKGDLKRFQTALLQTAHNLYDRKLTLAAMDMARDKLIVDDTDNSSADEINRAKVICEVLEKEYYGFITDDDHYNCVYESYVVNTDEFSGTALQWFNWICRASLTVDGDDHLCKKTLDRLAAPVTITGIEDEKFYWPAILCGEDAQPLIAFDGTKYNYNEDIRFVDVDDKESLKIIQIAVFAIADHIMRNIEYNREDN